MFKSKKPYTFGMELEINPEEHPNFHKFDWMRYSHMESDNIVEYQTMPCDGREFMRQSCVLGHMLGFEHHRGEWDERAESFHLHMGLKQDSPDYFNGDAGRDYANERTDNHGGRLRLGSNHVAGPMLIAADHMSRTGVKFRSYWADGVTVGSAWIINNGLGTLEMRLNENPAPLISTMLYPLVTDERFTLAPRVGVLSNDTEEGAPIRTAQTVRDAMGEDMVADMIREAKKYWNFKLVDESLDMFMDGATNVDVWKHADNYFKQTNGIYTRMLKEANI